jgi:hypothetical protein
MEIDDKKYRGYVSKMHIIRMWEHRVNKTLSKWF